MSRRDGDAFTPDEPSAEDEEEEEEDDDDDATRAAIELEKVARNGDPIVDAPGPPMARLCAPLAPAGTEECAVDTVETVGDGPAEPLCDAAAAAAAAVVALDRCGEAGTGTGEDTDAADADDAVDE